MALLVSGLMPRLSPHGLPWRRSCWAPGCSQPAGRRRRLAASCAPARPSSLRSTLSDVEQRVRDQDCTGASQQAAAFREQVDGLPERVDAALRQALVSSADRLEALVADQCTAEPAAPTVPTVGTTSEDPAQGNEDNQTGQRQKGQEAQEGEAEAGRDADTDPDAARYGRRGRGGSRSGRPGRRHVARRSRCGWRCSAWRSRAATGSRSASAPAGCRPSTGRWTACSSARWR